MMARRRCGGRSERATIRVVFSGHKIFRWGFSSGELPNNFVFAVSFVIGLSHGIAHRLQRFIFATSFSGDGIDRAPLNHCEEPPRKCTCTTLLNRTRTRSMLVRPGCTTVVNPRVWPALLGLVVVRIHTCRFDLIKCYDNESATTRTDGFAVCRMYGRQVYRRGVTQGQNSGCSRDH